MKASTSTKISVYENERELFTKELQHSVEELAPFESKSVTEQFAFRKNAIVTALSEHDMTMDDIDLFADKARGSVFFSLEHYIIDEKIVTRPNPEVSDLKMPAFFGAVY